MSKTKKTILIGYIFLLPMLIGLLILRVYGFIVNIFYSFNESSTSGFTDFSFGFDNYLRLFTDDQFWLSLMNTLKFLIIAIPILLAIAIVLAVFLNSKIKFRTTFRVIYFLPAVMLPVAVMQIFMWLFNTQYGLVNSVLVQIGFEPVSWFSSEIPATILVVMVYIFLNISVPVFILIGGLQRIPVTYYEAANVDGVSRTRQFFKITLPLLTPAIFFVLITQLISMFQLFDIPYIMFPSETGGIGINYTKTLVYYYYQTAFEYTGLRNYASALSVVLLIIILTVTAILYATQNKWVHREN